MFNFFPTCKTIEILSVSLLVAVLFGVADVAAEEELIGSEEYRVSCLSCHGVGGKGDGSMAKFLTITPTDLTKLSANNGGQYPGIKAGTYPFLRVFQIIDGRTVVSGHGDRPMPVWGDRYLIRDQGPKGTHEREIRARILELVYYIQSIQEE